MLPGYLDMGTRKKRDKISQPKGERNGRETIFSSRRDAGNTRFGKKPPVEE